MRETILEVSHLSYLYEGEHEALHNVSVSIKRGEQIAVIGSNGAGKSTFFLNLNGVLTPREGAVIYEGQAVGRSRKELNRLREHVGIVFQDADSQIIASTVYQEAAFGPMNLGLSREEVKERTDRALRYMDLEAMKDRPPHYLSGGEKKRVSIADILAMKPEVIIFDEPTASLDPVNTAMLEEVLVKLGKEGRTLLVSTHDVDFVYRWAERVLVFEGGRILADGAPEEIFRDSQVLKKAHLKKPVLLEVTELLVRKGLLGEGLYPHTVEELQKYF